MNEVEYERMQEQSETGRALLQELGEYFGCGPELSRIKRSIYKHTDCGAWLEIDDTGLHIGSIVEGSDAYVETSPLTWGEYLNMEPGALRAWLNQTIAYVEGEAAALWHEANDEPWQPFPVPQD